MAGRSVMWKLLITARGPASSGSARTSCGIQPPATSWLPAIAVDGKAVRGAAGPDGLIPYLLAAVTHGTGIMLAEHLTARKPARCRNSRPCSGN
jgi:hypothetical protein